MVGLVVILEAANLPISILFNTGGGWSRGLGCTCRQYSSITRYGESPGSIHPTGVGGMLSVPFWSMYLEGVKMRGRGSFWLIHSIILKGVR